ncbi:MAG: phytoene/squalene synthase family protein [Jatrophihabitans sp.]
MRRSEFDAAGVHGAALRAGYARCRTLNAVHGRTYYLATMLLPPAKRPFVHALYGFARHVDDLVDVADDTVDDLSPVDANERADRMHTWCADFLADLEWGATSDPVGRAVIDTITRWSIPSSYFVDFIDSMLMDLTVTSYSTYADLEKYMWGSAAVIGLQMLPILGRRDDGVRWDVLESHAIDLGTAFQLTNFIRDVGEDLRRGRVYLPQESLSMFGVDLDRLRRGVVDEAIRSLLAWEIERARRLYATAAAGIELVEATSRDCLRTAYTLYAEILDEVERADYDVFTRRAHVGARRRAAVGLNGLRAAVGARRAAAPTPIP